MRCASCHINPISPHETDHCDYCAETLRMKINPLLKRRKIFTVSIAKCTHPELYWYNEKRGEIYDCELHENFDFIYWMSSHVYVTLQKVNTAAFGPPQRGFILPQDCIVLSEREETV